MRTPASSLCPPGGLGCSDARPLCPGRPIDPALPGSRTADHRSGGSGTVGRRGRSVRRHRPGGWRTGSLAGGPDLTSPGCRRTLDGPERSGCSGSRARGRSGHRPPTDVHIPVLPDHGIGNFHPGLRHRPGQCEWLRQVASCPPMTGGGTPPCPTGALCAQPAGAPIARVGVASGSGSASGGTGSGGPVTPSPTIPPASVPPALPPNTVPPATVPSSTVPPGTCSLPSGQPVQPVGPRALERPCRRGWSGAPADGGTIGAPGSDRPR